MTKRLKLFIVGLFVIIPMAGNAVVPVISHTCTKVLLVSQIIDDSASMGGFHRTPPQIPNVYFDSSTSTVYFENPCYECTLELVIPGTDTAVYTSSIEDGAETFEIPNGFTGTYELHIHRGNFCFYGEIEL